MTFNYDPRTWNLRAKLLAASAAVTLAVGLLLTWQSNRRIAALAEDELRGLGKDAAANFATQAEQLVMLGNSAGLAAPLAELKANPIIYFVVVTDSKQKILASTWGAGADSVPKPIADRLFDEEKVDGSTYRSYDGVDFLEVEAMLMQGALGQVHVGLRRDYVAGVVNKQTRAALLTLLLVLSIGLGALAVALGTLIKPITQLSEVSRRIVEQGDLTQAVEVTSTDEIGVLAGHFKAMVERLREIPLTLSAQSAALNEAVKALEAATAAQNAVVTRQATALQETQVTAEEIRQTSQVAARSAEGILADISSAESAGERGTKALEQSLSGLEAILESVKGTAGSINDLGERTRQIGGITGTVKDLADQSNMLALNAAIEAVRSGEHGKGFALVAREIRRLADQSIQSTERVREILESVRGAVSTAIAGSEEGARKVEHSLGQMRASADSLRSLAIVVRDSSAAVRQIATAVNQQNTGVNQVFAAVVDQNKMMEESVKQLEGTLEAVSSLKRVSGGLAEVLAQYKA
jgi:methyl-accepting chemotaxis protein